MLSQIAALTISCLALQDLVAVSFNCEDGSVATFCWTVVHFRAGLSVAGLVTIKLLLLVGWGCRMMVEVGCEIKYIFPSVPWTRDMRGMVDG